MRISPYLIPDYYWTFFLFPFPGITSVDDHRAMTEPDVIDGKTADYCALLHPKDYHSMPEDILYVAYE
jgi:hypothetical protein